jgi:diguanylate cyclase (GGDEF)-like protein/PAS domain S-box-containing protein
MKFKLQNLRIGTRIALALSLPLAGLIALSIWVLVGYINTVRHTAQLHTLVSIIPATSSLVHAVQKERGVSANFIGSSGSNFGTRLTEQQRATDAERDEFRRSIDKFDTTRLGPSITEKLQRIEDRLKQLDGWRSNIKSKTLPVSIMTDNYAGLIDDLLEIIDEMRPYGATPEVSRTITTYSRIAHAKESAGMERAIGAAGFAAGRFDQTAHQRFIRMIERQKLYLKEFEIFASPDQLALLNKSFNDFNSTELERMRETVLERQSPNTSFRIGAENWFEITTDQIDRLRIIEDAISEDLAKTALDAEIAAKQAVWQVSTLTAGLIFFTALLAFILARGIINPVLSITRSMTKLAAREDDFDIEQNLGDDEIGDMAKALIIFKEHLLTIAHAEERLKSEAVLRLHHEALAAISQGVLITDANRRITYANPAFQRITGYSDTEIIGLTPSFLHNKGGDTKSLNALQDAIVAGHQYQGDLLNYKKDGTPFWSDLSINPVVDAQGKTTHYVGVTRDVTETRLMHQELRIAATAFESLHGIMVTDAKGIILRVNNAFTEMTGYSADEVVGQTPALLKSGRHEAEFYAEMWQQLSATGAWYGEVWDRRKNGEIFPKWQTITAVRGADKSTTHYVSAFTDISENKAAEAEIANLAFFDPLTQLPNRRLLLDRLQHALATSDRQQRNAALMFIDLDNFKTLNDTLGHDKGDLLLQQVATRLSACVREGDTVARIGGDEFVLILEGLSNNLSEAANQSEQIGEKILESLNQPYDLVTQDYHTTPSIGITLFCGHSIGVDELLKQADLAMYQSKAAGRNTLHFFEPDMQASVSARSTLESDLRRGLRENQFSLAYQPQVFEKRGQVTGVEALLRWNHPTRGPISPAEFIPVAEETGLILPLGLWVLETACTRLACWAKDPITAHLSMAVNVSARQFNHPDFIEQVTGTLARTKASPERLKLELTESLFLNNVEDTISKMMTLKVLGITFSLDDFGTGYSSLTYLKRLPLDQLKIDQSFIRDVLTDPNDAAITRAIVALGQNLGLKIIAEGVETAGQQEFLADHGCHAYQGYLYSRPLAIDAFERYLNKE